MAGAEREHAVERFTTFADAVVAIAITLLAIPLIDLAREAPPDLAAWWDESWSPLLGLAISFAVVARIWWSHHRVYEHVVRLDGLLVWTTFVWLLTIVLLPIATALTTSGDPSDRAGSWRFAVYLGVMIASGLTLLAQSVLVLRRPELTDGEDRDAVRRVVASAETVAGFVLALVIGLLLPQVNYFAFLVLALTGRLDRPVVRAIERRRRRGGEQRPGVR